MPSREETVDPTVIKHETKYATSKIFSNDTTLVNWMHVGVVAPALALLKYNPQYVQWTPAAAGVIAAVHRYVSLVLFVLCFF